MALSCQYFHLLYNITRANVARQSEASTLSPSTQKIQSVVLTQRDLQLIVEAVWEVLPTVFWLPQTLCLGRFRP